MIHKDAPSQHLSSMAGDAPSVSTRLSMGPPTVFSHVSQSTAARTTPQHRRASTALWPFPYRQSDNSSSSRRNPTYQFSNGIVRPGPSLIEPVIEPDNEPILSPWRSHNMFDIHGDGDLLSRNRSNINRRGRNELESRQSASTMERSYEPRPSDGNFPHKRRADIHFSRLRTSCFSPEHNAQEPPRASQSRLSDFRDDVGSLVGTDERREVFKKKEESVVESRVASEAASLTLASAKYSINSNEKGQSEKENMVPPKAVPKKRPPRKIFKTSAVQTESSSISKSTQTNRLQGYVSRSVQTEPVAVLLVREDRSAHAEAPKLNSAAKVFANTTKILTTTEESCGDLVCSPLPKKCQLPINKFGQSRRRVPAPAQKMQNMAQLETSCEGGSHTNIMLPQRSARGINKFGRAQRKVH